MIKKHVFAYNMLAGCENTSSIFASSINWCNLCGRQCGNIYQNSKHTYSLKSSSTNRNSSCVCISPKIRIFITAIFVIFEDWKIPKCSF